MQAAVKVFQDISPKLKLSENPSVANLPLSEVKHYLTRNLFKYCVLVVNADQVKGDYENIPQQKVEYKELLETAVDNVDGNIITFVCDNCSLPPEDQATVSDAIERIINKRGNGLTAWLKNEKLSVDQDVLVQFLSSTSAEAQRGPKPRPTKLFENSANQPHGAEVRQWQPRFSPAEKSIVMLKSKVRNGIISYQPKDLEIMYPGFRVPDYISQLLLNEYCDTSVAEIRIASDNDGKLRWFVEGAKSKELPTNEGIEIAADETLMLSTCVRYGKLSLEKDDLQFIHPGWQIPQFILNSLKREYETTSKAYLYVISDEQGNLRCKVIVGTYGKALGAANKAWRRVTDYRS